MVKDVHNLFLITGNNFGLVMVRAQECYVLFFALSLKPSQPVIYGTVPEIVREEICSCSELDN
jgi:uncharacterized protein YjfI (DUF2170 family)